MLNAGTGLQNAQDELAQRRGELGALRKIGQALAATLDLNEIYWPMYREIVSGLLGPSSLFFALYEAETQSITCSFLVEDGREKDAGGLPPLTLGHGPLSDAIRSRKLKIDDLDAAYSSPGMKVILVGAGETPKSAIYLPLVNGDDVVGVICMRHLQPDDFHPTVLEMSSVLASQAAVAITNARLFAKFGGTPPVWSGRLESGDERRRRCIRNQSGFPPADWDSNTELSVLLLSFRLNLYFIPIDYEFDRSAFVCPQQANSLNHP